MSEESGIDPVGGKRLGFQFKGTSKRQKIIETESKPQVDIITTIEGSNINSINPVKEKEVLVIPLVQPVAQPIPSKSIATRPEPVPLAQETTVPLTLDQIAAAELLREIEENGDVSNDPIDSLVIKQAEKPVADETSRAKKKAPLLMLNVAPELLSIKDENDRFKYDVSSRAEDLNVKSDIYESIPVTQFGAALLRGMGWQGPDKAEARKKEEKLVAREQRLGLGAQAKPPDMPKKGKANPLVSSSSGGASSAGQSTTEKRKEEERRRWEKRAEERLKDQKLFDGDFVWLRAPTELSGKRAEVVAARGVPGLDRVRIQLEHSGRVVEVPRRDCVLLSPSELDDKPFKAAENSAVQRKEQTRGLAQTQFRGLSASDNDNLNSSSAVKQEGAGKNSSKPTGAGSSSSGGDSSSSRVSIKKESNQGSSSSAPTAKQVQSVFWLREGIRVKVVSRSVGGSRAYLQKGTVLDVYSRGRASLRLDDGSVLDEVNERHVETIVPAVGAPCLVLLGEHRGQTAVLLERRRDQQSVLVQLSEELEVVELDMDSIAATSR